jgi:diketogulonate reductase-like aldo/keto reductase
MMRRRDFIGACSALGVAAAINPAAGQQSMPTRSIPSTGEALPVIGRRMVDTWPRDPTNDAAFGTVVNTPEFAGRLFVTTKIDQEGRDAGIAQFRETQRLYGRERLDLAQIFSLTDLDTHWPTLRSLKDEGAARYIGVTVAEYRLYDALLAFLERETPDFVQVNYSITERRAEERILPLLAERGIAALINRPFMNGAYFSRLEDTPLPEWTREIGCESWAQFSLKYILANPNVTCVLTETTNPTHMAENTRAALGALPDDAMRGRMRELIESA